MQQRLASLTLKNQSDATSVLDGLLSNEATPLVGFGMARLAMHLRAGLNLNVVGVDIPTLFPDRNAATSPGFCVRTIRSNADGFKVDQLWSSVHISDDVSDNDWNYLSMRAWISFEYVCQSIADLRLKPD